jgi:hypothetical protein
MTCIIWGKCFYESANVFLISYSLLLDIKIDAFFHSCDLKIDET